MTDVRRKDRLIKIVKRTGRHPWPVQEAITLLSRWYEVWSYLKRIRTLWYGSSLIRIDKGMAGEQYFADCTTDSSFQPTSWYSALYEPFPVVSWKGESTAILNSSNLRHEVMRRERTWLARICKSGLKHCNDTHPRGEFQNRWLTKSEGLNGVFKSACRHSVNISACCCFS